MGHEELAGAGEVVRRLRKKRAEGKARGVKHAPVEITEADVQRAGEVVRKLREKYTDEPPPRRHTREPDGDDMPPHDAPIHRRPHVPPAPEPPRGRGVQEVLASFDAKVRKGATHATTPVVGAPALVKRTGGFGRIASKFPAKTAAGAADRNTAAAHADYAKWKADFIENQKKLAAQDAEILRREQELQAEKKPGWRAKLSSILPDTREAYVERHHEAVEAKREKDHSMLADREKRIPRWAEWPVNAPKKDKARTAREAAEMLRAQRTSLRNILATERAKGDKADARKIEQAEHSIAVVNQTIAELRRNVDLLGLQKKKASGPPPIPIGGKFRAITQEAEPGVEETISEVDAERARQAMRAKSRAELREVLARLEVSERLISKGHAERVLREIQRGDGNTAESFDDRMRAALRRLQDRGSDGAEGMRRAPEEKSPTQPPPLPSPGRWRQMAQGARAAESGRDVPVANKFYFPPGDTEPTTWDPTVRSPAQDAAPRDVAKAADVAVDASNDLEKMPKPEIGAGEPSGRRNVTSIAELETGADRLLEAYTRDEDTEPAPKVQDPVPPEEDFRPRGPFSWYRNNWYARRRKNNLADESNDFKRIAHWEADPLAQDAETRKAAADAALEEEVARRGWKGVRRLDKAGWDRVIARAEEIEVELGKKRDEWNTLSFWEKVKENYRRIVWP